MTGVLGIRDGVVHSMKSTILNSVISDMFLQSRSKVQNSLGGSSVKVLTRHTFRDCRLLVMDFEGVTSNIVL